MSKYQKKMMVTQIKTGDIVTANRDASDYHLTENQKYQVLDFDGDCILVMTDIGEMEWFSRDYFLEFKQASV